MRRLGWMLMIALAPALGAQEQSDSGALPNADAALSGQGGRADPPPPATAPPAGDGAQAGGAPATLAHRSPTPPSRSRLAAPCALAISLPAGVAESISNTRQCESDQPITDTTSHAGQRMLMDRSESGARLAQRGQTP